MNSVEKGGPAEKAGIEAGDIIVKFDGKQVESSSDLPRIVGVDPARQQGRRSRSGARAGPQKLSITVAELQEDRVAAADKPASAPSRRPKRRPTASASWSAS